MCRWLSYIGDPVYLEKLVFEPRHSLVEQSLHAEQAKTPTNGDGFGIGWYDERKTPGRGRVFHCLDMQRVSAQSQTRMRR